MSTPNPPDNSGRGWRVFLAAALAVAVTGYLVGLRESRRTSQSGPQLPVPEAGETTESEGTLARAPKYAELPSKKIGPNREWTSNLANLTQPPPPPPPKTAPTREMLRQALLERAQRRAYEGAPPSIPHPASPNDAACLLCHQDGKQIGDKFAHRMCHSFHANCTQCHIEAVPGQTVAAFVPPLDKVGGPRAFPGAPPAMPHTAWMREDCLACHGPTGLPGLRTTHPERLSCLQCHALTSPLDPAPSFAELRP